MYIPVHILKKYIYIFMIHTHSHLLTCLPQATRLCMGEGDLCVENISGTLGTDFEKKILV